MDYCLSQCKNILTNLLSLCVAVVNSLQPDLHCYISLCNEHFIPLCLCLRKQIKTIIFPLLVSLLITFEGDDSLLQLVIQFYPENLKMEFLFNLDNCFVDHLKQVNL